jgi:hypothetical protein
MVDCESLFPASGSLTPGTPTFLVPEQLGIDTGDEAIDSLGHGLMICFFLPTFVLHIAGMTSWAWEWCRSFSMVLVIERVDADI